MKSIPLFILLSSSPIGFSFQPPRTNYPPKRTIYFDRCTQTFFQVYNDATVQDAGEQTKSTISINVPDQSSPYVIHKGRATDMIKRCVSIEGLSLSKGWTPQATQAFQLAIEAVVRANPILTGKLIEVKPSPWPWASKELHVLPNAYNPKNHSFCTLLEAPNDLLSPGEVLEEEGTTCVNTLFDYMSSTFAPFMLDKPDFTFKQIANKTPLFQGKNAAQDISDKLICELKNISFPPWYYLAKIIDFGDSHAAYSIKMSHAIGDGTTYFQLVSQISAYMNGNEPPPIIWDNPMKSTHEIYPDSFTERDYHRSYGLPFGWGLLKNLRALPQRRCKYILLSKDKILKVKNAMRSNKTKGTMANKYTMLKEDDEIARSRISTNDIVMSAICELNESSDVFAFDRSIRGIKKGVNAYDAGNFFWEIPFDKAAGKDPVEIRKILLKDSGSFYDSDTVPLMPFLNGRVGRITSLATITHQTTFPGSELLCQFPSASFISELPLDVAVIFKFNSDYWVSR